MTDPILTVSAPRRVLDVAVALALMVLALPVVLLAAAAIVLTDGRPVLFRQPRVGEGGRPFEFYKLRTMTVSTDGPSVTAADDPRVTRVGALLRKTSVDELPQLWHVLRGQMTLVGPRPESVRLAARYPAEYRVVLRARPGLTGPAQLAYRERAAVPPRGWTDPERWYVDVLVPRRAEADLDFLRRPSPVRVLGYLLLTGANLLGLRDTERTVPVPVTGWPGLSTPAPPSDVAPLPRSDDSRGLRRP